MVLGFTIRPPDTALLRIFPNYAMPINANNF